MGWNPGVAWGAGAQRGRMHERGTGPDPVFHCCGPLLKPPQHISHLQRVQGWLPGGTWGAGSVHWGICFMGTRGSYHPTVPRQRGGLQN